MVGYNEKASNQLTDFQYAVSGAIAGAATRGVCQPLDVIKIRFQLQVEPLKQHHGAKYWSVSQAARLILKDEGLSALWKGHIPAQALSIMYGVCQVTSFEFLTKQLWFLLPHWRGENYRPYIHFICGASAGVLANSLSYPFDTVRTRLVAQGEPKLYLNMRHAFSSIWKKEGVLGFYRGLTPVLIQMAPHTGIQFASYTFLQDILHSKVREAQLAIVPLNLLVGAIAGVVAKTAVYPLDLVKKRLQIVGFEEGRVGFGKSLSTRSLRFCLTTTFRNEGITGLFKGWWPSTLKASLVSALFFAFYEACCTLQLRGVPNI